ncbi:UDP-glucose dehydrogenase family protein [Cellulomonas chengniuliangii]|uniref:UDP-glucose 6-dehydrogenase n=1 Tax=Cellulomonas chengniuliangii TaxID=2968084 RepID=A0ABY5KVS7_9CELL|nr:UDP-glucose/GDP-mannose dehydrogenase family protein [Cellulomonas chengniuliangii]MCC2310066.1 UDP-glucose/GDP-mannose dehydrogenase family protein [Cellulomonas chengniuliangii]UUI74539.1 UDP-glucose/GDP-mannose dehydrogenase family protein [Cellulomonas chengniuliangii]
MRISVIGCGYLGAVHAAAMASLGHEVVGIEVDAHKAASLSAGNAPFFEPGLPEILREGVASGRLAFSTDMGDAAGAKVHFVCVGTPQKPGEFAADLTQVEQSFTMLLPHLAEGDVVVGKSTVPVGTAEALAVRLTSIGATLIWNPEFLREGFAVQDTLHPDRLVYGLPTDDTGTSTEAGEKARQALDEVYSVTLSEGTPLVVTDYATAQLVKVAANSFLATKISFINAMSELCEVTGADVTRLADAIGYDVRIGRQFLNAGLGFGGGCLPKDIRAFMARAGELGVDQALSFLREVDAINMRRRVRMVDLAREMCNGSIAGLNIAVLGAAFKPLSDDIRDSPALSVAAQMQLQGARVTVTDPQAIDNARRKWPELRFAPTALEAAEGADVVLLATEWAEYRELDPVSLGKVVRERRMLDGRNVLDPTVWRGADWTYRALGRP